MLLLMVVAMLVLVVTPFVCGFFAQGSELLMRPSMYVNLYLLFMAGLGAKVKSFVTSKF